MRESHELLTEPTTIGRYDVIARLGEGGMAETWLARFQGTHGFAREVVIKTLKLQFVGDLSFRQMFADEALLGELLDHPNVPRIEELGEHQGVPFMVQEHVEGPSLDAFLRKQRAHGALDLRLAAVIVRDIATTLHHVFTAPGPDGRPLRVIHRDVSPSNILLSTSGKAYLIDFGISMYDGRRTHTQAGVRKGKPPYMAPEATVRGASTHQSDIYSLGLVLYQLCVGATSWPRFLEQHVRPDGRLPPLSEVRRDVPASLEAIVEQAIAVDPGQRYHLAQELAHDLWRWLDSAEALPEATLPGQIHRLFPGGAGSWRPVIEGPSTPTFPSTGRSATRVVWPLLTLGAGAATLVVVGMVLVLALVGLMLPGRSAPPGWESLTVGGGSPGLEATAPRVASMHDGAPPARSSASVSASRAPGRLRAPAPAPEPVGDAGAPRIGAPTEAGTGALSDSPGALEPSDEAGGLSAADGLSEGDALSVGGGEGSGPGEAGGVLGGGVPGGGVPGGGVPGGGTPGGDDPERAVAVGGAVAAASVAAASVASAPVAAATTASVSGAPGAGPLRPGSWRGLAARREARLEITAVEGSRVQAVLYLRIGPDERPHVLEGTVDGAEVVLSEGSRGYQLTGTLGPSGGGGALLLNGRPRGTWTVEGG